MSRYSKKTVCLCMIVKNESQVIKDTLENLCEKIAFSYWTISDTGSTDDTREIITDFFKSKNIPGELVEHEWKDFGYNRTKALEIAYNKSDYVLTFDADDRLCGDFKLPTPMNCDRYNLIIGQGFRYFRSLLISNRLRWKFVGVLHEYLECIDKDKTEETISGDYHVESNRCGYRSRNPNKYLDDAKILEVAFEKEMEKSEKGLAYRYAFYCAQSYRDCGMKDESIKWYKKVLTLGNWHQEKYFSCVMIGVLYKDQGNFANSLEYLLKAEEYDQERTEGIIIASEMLRIHNHHMIVTLLYKKYKNYNKYPAGKLFLLKDHYDEHKFELNTFISACEIKDFTTAYECAKAIINNCKVERVNKSILDKLHVCKDIIKNDPNSLELFNKVDQMIYELRYKEDVKDPKSEMFLTWNVLHETSRRTLTQVRDYKFKNKRSPSVFISFTTCKRYELFEQTIRSILNQWTDVKKIDYWFCVDDNSSASHRAKMTRNFPWIEYCFKSENEKGHLTSMNIIHNKLLELKPKYWIHMEDDFLFHYKTNYVEKSINALELLRKDGVRQILFNVNYAETIEDYRIKGGIEVVDDELTVEIHDYKEGTFHYSNCHYWPNYSFRPSMSSVDEILEIGDFSSKEAFFEGEYAKRYTSKGYKSAFFDRITNKHIGRLTSERFDKNKSNAYQLNNVEQFENKDGVKEPDIDIGTEIPIKIINLEKRPDRRENTINEFARHNIKSSSLEFIKAVDGSLLHPSMEIYNLFKNNDFGGRKGFIGCALSHYYLWKQLLNDKDNEYYLIFEDDIKLSTNFTTKLVSLKDKYVQSDFLLLGYHMFERVRNQVKHIYDVQETEALNIAKLEEGLYIGGFFAYSISKKGAKKLLDYISEKGIGHGIDYVLKLASRSGDIIANELRPHIVFSEWYEHVNIPVDTDIQQDMVGFDFSDMSTFRPKDVNVKMLCNWCGSKQLCEEWSNMCQDKEGFAWYGKNKKIKMVYDNAVDIDYYVIINSTTEYYDPKKTIVFQMEPWIDNENKKWGVKTWGEWACPSESKFMHVCSHKKYLNNVQWLLKTGLNDISKGFNDVSKSDKIASVCSQKNYDEGHMLRNDFIRYLECNSEYIKSKMVVFGRENYHNFKTYAGQLRDDDKTNSIVPYKYHIAFENNSEHNYATEKIWEPILCETLCFYWGCPNLEEHLDSNAFVRLDATDFDGSMKIIERAIKEDWWTQRIDSIRKEKKRILEEIAFFPNLEKLIEKYE
jgi:GR25 family glycosyltransferase involved in LPS biosynthesis